MEETRQEMAPEQEQTSARPYWETLPRKQVEGIIRGNIQTADRKMSEMTALFCSAGYYLRRQQAEEQWRETGAANFTDYVRDTYGKSRGWATRMMQINERYSIGGNDPRLDKKYQSFSVSQLQEMLYLTDEEAQGVTPDMTVKQIRQQRPAPAPVQDPDQDGQDPDQNDQDGSKTERGGDQNTAEGKGDPGANEGAAGGRDFATSQKRNITWKEWNRLFDWFRLTTTDEDAAKIGTDALRLKHRHSACMFDGFNADCSNVGVVINGSRLTRWGEVADRLMDVYIDRCRQEDEKTATVPEEIPESATEEQAGDVIDLADFCDVANNPEADPEDAEVAGENPPEDLPAAWSMDLTDLQPEDIKDAIRADYIPATIGMNIIQGIVDGIRELQEAEEGSRVPYSLWDVRRYMINVQSQYDSVLAVEKESAAAGQEGFPKSFLQQRQIEVDAALLLLKYIQSKEEGAD